MIHSNPDLIASYLMRKQFQSRGDDLLAGWDFTSGWNLVDVGPPVIIDATSFSSPGPTGQCGIRPTGTPLTIGVSYVMHIAGTTTCVSGVRIRESSGDTAYITTGTGAFDETFTFTTDETRFYIQNRSPGTTEFSKLELYPVTLMDLSGNGNDATITPGTGGFTTGPDGKVNGAYEFDGANTTIVTPITSNSNFTSGFAVSCWINPTSYGESGAGRIISKENGTGGQNGFALMTRLSSTSLSFIVNAGTIINSGTLSIGVMQHVLLLVAPDGITSFYIDGVLSGTPADAGNLADITTVNPLTIGNRSTAIDRTFNGGIAFLDIYKAVYGQDFVSHQFKKFQQQIQSGRFKGLI